jgi:signal transduction histidine kinase
MIHFVNSDYRKQNVNIIKELDASIQDFSKLIEEKDIHIIKKYKPDSSVIVHIDKAPLVLCFTNILKNAIRYSNE